MLRAAAHEPRIDRVIAYDIYPDALDVNLRQLSWLKRHLLTVWLKLCARAVVNQMASRAVHNSPVADWGIVQDMHVTATSPPFDYLTEIAKYTTADVSPMITQDVLLLAGNADHFVPVEHFHRQIRMLKNARSITARLFTEKERAGNHCQVGNYGLALKVIVNWLDALTVSASNPDEPTMIELAKQSQKASKAVV